MVQNGERDQLINVRRQQNVYLLDVDYTHLPARPTIRFSTQCIYPGISAQNSTGISPKQGYLQGRLRYGPSLDQRLDHDEHVRPARLESHTYSITLVVIGAEFCHEYPRRQSKSKGGKLIINSKDTWTLT